ncbi:MAG: SDR family oxidoreductase [Mesorhizobium sp.]|nr:MAG: SDR family oxidoreductase [Mesorhizobium sp.]RWM85679.1 MAG: SDR family oxidoreductase [Mesorhizobium sp.]TIO14271.1 MAG: SDR family oxidoreductase [Mesorhizobium sp.]TIP92834.1 MAG: SDR family oxidoreductase [Mesorhizobium sp.]
MKVWRAGMRSTVIVFGGTGGIGAATVELAIGRGFDVVLTYADQAEDGIAAALCDRLGGCGAMVQQLRADITREDNIGLVFDRAKSSKSQLAGVVNCVGIDCTKRVAAELDAAELRRLFDINTIGTMLVCKHAAQAMLPRHGGTGGAIVNVSSMAVTIGGRSGSAAYAASKAAVDIFTVGTAKELASQGIRVNCVRPAMTLTPATLPYAKDPIRSADIVRTIPMGRMARAEEIAAPILWLLSPEASFVTGACLDVSGGGFLVGMNRVDGISPGIAS